MVILQLGINDAGIHISCNSFTLQKICQLCIDIFVSLLQNFGNDIIVAGGEPVRACLTSGAEIVDNRPRVINFGIAEAVTIVPIAQFVELIGSAVIGGHLGNFICGEAEIGVVLLVQHRIDNQIIQPAEDTFFCYAQDAGQETKGQAAIIFETAGEKPPHERNGIIVKSHQVPLLNGSVVLIYDNDGRAIIVLVQHGRKRLERRDIVGAVSSAGNNTLINGFLEVIASGAIGKVGVAQILFTNQSVRWAYVSSHVFRLDSL